MTGGLLARENITYWFIILFVVLGLELGIWIYLLDCMSKVLVYVEWKIVSVLPLNLDDFRTCGRI